MGGQGLRSGARGEIAAELDVHVDGYDRALPSGQEPCFSLGWWLGRREGRRDLLRSMIRMTLANEFRKERNDPKVRRMTQTYIHATRAGLCVCVCVWLAGVHDWAVEEDPTAFPPVVPSHHPVACWLYILTLPPF